MAEVGRTLLSLGLPTTGMLFQNVLAEDPAAALLEGVTEGKHAGQVKIGDRATDHLTFKQLSMDWELWVAADGPPFVLKTKSINKSQNGQVTTIESYTNWKLNAEFARDPFTFKPPDDATKVDRLDGQRAR